MIDVPDGEMVASSFLKVLLDLVAGDDGWDIFTVFTLVGPEKSKSSSFSSIFSSGLCGDIEAGIECLQSQSLLLSADLVWRMSSFPV